MKTVGRTALVTTPSLVLLSVCMLLIGFSAARADETDDLIKEVLRQKRNAAAAAKELLTNAKGLTDAPAVQVRLCEKAYECGIASPAGYGSALAALDVLAKIAPDRAAAWDDKRLEVYRLRYLRCDRKDKLANGRTYVQMLLAQAERCGKNGKWSDAAKFYGLALDVAKTLRLPETPAIYQQAREAGNWVLVYSRLERLKAAVAKNPDDSSSRKRLVETYLVDLDMPAEAAKHLGDTLDPTLRKNVSLAAREASGLADADFLTLGQWYRSLAARTAAGTPKARLLARARDNMKMFLEVHTKKDLQQLRVAKALKSVEAELKRLGVAAAPKTTRPQPVTLDLGRGVKMKLVGIPAGTFMMGSDKSPTQKPIHQVTISKPFYMGVTEVTQAQWSAVTGTLAWGRYVNSRYVKSRGDHAASFILWNETTAFCRALSKKTGRTVRLPTEAEWEYACRAGATTQFGFGNDAAKMGDYAWYSSNASDKGQWYAHPVHVKKPNAWGLYDMHGNVWEWCADWAGPYANAGARDPKGPAAGTARVLRGGSVRDSAWSCSSAIRFVPALGIRYFHCGFRVVVEVK